jgi:hypothetical protein
MSCVVIIVKLRFSRKGCLVGFVEDQVAPAQDSLLSISVSFCQLSSFVFLFIRCTYLIWNVFSVVYSVFVIVLSHCNTFCYYSYFSSVFCTVHCSCIVLRLFVMYVLLHQLRFFHAFFSVVRQMPGYNS